MKQRKSSGKPTDPSSEQETFLITSLNLAIFPSPFLRPTKHLENRLTFAQYANFELRFKEVFGYYMLLLTLQCRVGQNLISA